jgi:hypothetical protein
MMKKSSRLALGFAAAILTAVAGAQTPSKATPPAAPAKPSPDVIVFTNGDQLSGTLERGVGDSIVFKSDMAGEITVKLDKVRELRSTGSFALLRKDVPVTRTSVQQPGTVIFADGNVTVANPEGVPEVVPVKQMGYLIDQTTYDRELERRPGPWFGWNGAITGGATLVRSTSNVNTYTAGISLHRAIPSVPFLPARNRTTFNLQETYGKQTTPVIPQTVPSTPDEIVKTSIFHADAERDEYFTTQLYALGQATFDHNFAQGLDLQEVYGGGIGWTPFKTPRQQLDVKADVHYEKQQFQTATGDQNLIGSTFSEAYRRTLPRKLLFTETANALPAWNNFSAYSANASAALAMPLFKRLSMQFTTTDNFLNDPAPGFKKNSFQFVTGVTYNLR